jgi:hypothetical protein
VQYSITGATYKESIKIIAKLKTAGIDCNISTNRINVSFANEENIAPTVKLCKQYVNVYLTKDKPTYIAGC